MALIFQGFGFVDRVPPGIDKLTAFLATCELPRSPHIPLLSSKVAEDDKKLVCYRVWFAAKGSGWI